MTTTTQDTYLTERIAEQERYLAYLEDKYAGLRDGTVHWSEWCEDYTCPDRQQVAIDECGSALDDARTELDRMRAALGSAGDGD